MGKRELIARELVRLPEQDLDKLLAMLRSLRDAHTEAVTPMLTAQSSLAQDRSAPEEDAAWASLWSRRCQASSVGGSFCPWY
jgi:hypothetical protein